MKKNYYLVQQGEQQGPLTFDTLLKTDFTLPAQVWAKGLPDWLTVTGTTDLITKLGADAASPESVAQLVYTNPEASIRAETLLNGYTNATAGRRLGALLINFTIALVLGTMLHKSHQTLSSIMLFFFMPITSLLTYPLWGGTVGHRLLGIKVIHAETGEVVNGAITGALRELTKIISCSLVLPVFWLLFDAKKQNVYDKLFGTLVVNNTKNNNA